jgi:small subunit ribosomal protein S13
MARIAGINLPKEKRIAIGLTAIYGIGRPLARRILEESKIDQDIRVHALTEEQVNKLRDKVTEFVTEGDLRRKIQLDVKYQSGNDEYENRAKAGRKTK